ncbi:MAG: acetylxylan esterase [Microlunatus sp.]|nr:acetylxylan esterase [Microlunatus sp.]
MHKPVRVPDLWSSDRGSERSIDLWESSRRPELLRLFADHVYGRTPPGGRLDDLITTSRTDHALNGSAIRIEAELVLAGPSGAKTVSLLIYAPASAAGHPAPAFLGLNFQGNQAVSPEPDVRPAATTEAIGAAHGRDPVAPGAESRRWPLDLIIERGYAVATICYEDLEIDLPGYAESGVRGLFPRGSERSASDWGAIGGWAWGLSRALDALTEIDEIDDRRMIAVGHSRLGKTALWAAAQDQRFAGVISNESGCGGASLFRHRGIEDVDVITAARPHWFAPRFADYRGIDEQLPVDQHQLLALQAPRLTHVGSALLDAGADPAGEFLSTLYASPIFELYGHQGTRPAGADQAVVDRWSQQHAAILPPPDQTIGGRLSYHLRDGEHDMLAEDWRHLLTVTDQHLGIIAEPRRSPTSHFRR